MNLKPEPEMREYPTWQDVRPLRAEIQTQLCDDDFWQTQVSKAFSATTRQ